MKKSELSSRAYRTLKSRGYTDELILEDEVTSRMAGRHVLHGMQVKLHCEHLLWPCRSMGHALAGFSIANLDEKDYNFRRNPLTPYLATYYASEHDLDLIYTGRKVILTEGIYDRIALKIGVPDYPVMARLTKGVGRDLVQMLKHYVNTVYVCFDNDDAGRLGLRSARKKMDSFARVINLPYPARDPNDFLRKAGPRKVREHFQKKMELYW